MKTVSRINDVTRNGVQKSTKCGIVVNAKAFDMLARQYSDPIKAILQELGANAVIVCGNVKLVSIRQWCLRTDPEASGFRVGVGLV